MRLEVIERAIEIIEAPAYHIIGPYACIAISKTCSELEDIPYGFLERPLERIYFERVFVPPSRNPDASYWDTDEEGKHTRLMAMELFKQLIISGDLIHWEEA